MIFMKSENEAYKRKIIFGQRIHLSLKRLKLASMVKTPMEARSIMMTEELMTKGGLRVAKRLSVTATHKMVERNLRNKVSLFGGKRTRSPIKIATIDQIWCDVIA